MLDPKSLKQKQASWQLVSRYPREERTDKRELKIFLATARLDPPVTYHGKTLPAANRVNSVAGKSVQPCWRDSNTSDTIAKDPTYRKVIFERILLGLQSQEAKIWKMPDLRMPESLTCMPFVTAFIIELQWQDHLFYIHCYKPSIPENDDIQKCKIKTSLTWHFQPLSVWLHNLTKSWTNQVLMTAVW